MKSRTAASVALLALAYTLTPLAAVPAATAQEPAVGAQGVEAGSGTRTSVTSPTAGSSQTGAQAAEGAAAAPGPQPTLLSPQVAPPATSPTQA